MVLASIGIVLLLLMQAVPHTAQAVGGPTHQIFTTSTRLLTDTTTGENRKTSNVTAHFSCNPMPFVPGVLMMLRE